MIFDKKNAFCCSDQNGQLGPDRLPPHEQRLPLAVAADQLQGDLQEQQARLRHLHSQALDVSTHETSVQVLVDESHLVCAELNFTE